MDLVYQCIISCTAIIPLVVALVIYVKKAVNEKNWRALVKIMYSLVLEAQQKYLEQTDRIEYIVAMTLTTASEIGYDIDEQSIRDFVNDIINLTNSVSTIESARAHESQDKEI